jgi:hypothetical protein
MPKKKKETDWIRLAILVIATLTAYHNIFGNEFILDDRAFILDWDATRSVSNLPSMLWGAVPPGHEGVYRPFRGLYYTLSFMFFGVNPLWYHIQAVLVHLACTLLVFYIAWDLTGNRDAAVMTGMVFGVHTIHTEAVTYITTSFDEIGTLLMLASLLLYLRWRLHGDKRLFYGSIALAAAAFYSYEITLTLPVLIILYELLFRKAKIKTLLSEWKTYAPYLAGVSTYLFIRMGLLNVTSRGGYFAGSFYHTLLAMTKALYRYVWMTILPVNLTFTHVLPGGVGAFSLDANKQAVLSQSILDPTVIGSLAVTVALLVAAYRYRASHPVIAFSVAWFFTTLSPVSNIIPQFSLFSERYLYLPSMGYCLILGYTGSQILNHYKRNHDARRIIWAGFTCIILFYTILTLQRNTQWSNSLDFWTSNLQQYPGSSIATTSLGNAYMEAGMPEKAVECFQKAVDANPDYSPAYYNLGTYHLLAGDYQAAGEYFKKAVSLDPGYVKAYNNLGTVNLAFGQTDEAIENYLKAIELNPTFTKAYNNLGIAYQQKGDSGRARDAYIQALKINPGYGKARENLESL